MEKQRKACGKAQWNQRRPDPQRQSTTILKPIFDTIETSR
jgi:hypothetical protein